MMIIVTGGAGFIGSNIVNALNKKGITDILVVDNLENSIKFVNLVDLNISDYMDKKVFLTQIIEGKQFGNIEAIFHQGACSSTTERDGNYVMNNNYWYSKEILHFCLKNKVPFLYASSAATYGNCTSKFIESRKYEKPLSLYGYSKFLFDEYVRHIIAKATSQIVGLRYFNVYGPRENHKRDMASIIFRLNNQLNKGENPKLFEGSERYKRDFIYVDDVVAVNLWFLEHRMSGIFNLGTGCAESFQRVANIVLSFHKKGSIQYISFPETLKKQYQTFTKANLNNLHSVGYCKSFKTIVEGITEYMSWLNRAESI